MKRPMHILTLTTLIVGASIIVSLIVSPADGSKHTGIESGDIAFVDVFMLVDRALSTDGMVAEREQFNTESTASLKAAQEQMQSLQTQLSTMGQDDPNAGQVYSQYQQAQYNMQNASDKINGDYQTLIANEISTAYAAIYAAANEIGRQEGYSFVFASRASGELIQTDTITGITQEILARPLMTPPSGVDLTELVRVKLGYPEKSQVTDAPMSEDGADDSMPESDDQSDDQAGDQSGDEADNKPGDETPADDE